MANGGRLIFSRLKRKNRALCFLRRRRDKDPEVKFWTNEGALAARLSLQVERSNLCLKTEIASSLDNFKRQPAEVRQCPSRRVVRRRDRSLIRSAPYYSTTTSGNLS